MELERITSVLVAEDDAFINEGTVNQLTRLGFTIAGQAFDGPQAVELARAEHPAVVLMDVQMVDPDTGREDAQAGLKAAHSIHQAGSSAVVLLTAHESPELVRRAGEAGVSAYLVKLQRAISIGRARHEDFLRLRLLNAELRRNLAELRASHAQAKTLRGLIPICAACKKIRNERGIWEPLENYIQDHSEAQFTHGFCRECCTRLYPGILPPDWKG
jgi:two-component system, response regulator PdtaR